METQSHYSADVEEAKELVGTAENSVIGGFNPGVTFIRIYPKWKYSREQLVEFIKKCRFAIMKWNNQCKKVYWLGASRLQFQQMLQAQEYSTERTTETLDIEQEVFQVRRTAFIDCAFFTPNDLMLFQVRDDVERRIEGGFIMNWTYFNWWSAIHRDFINNNADCLGLALTQNPEGVNFTVRELLFNFLLLRTDDLVNA